MRFIPVMLLALSCAVLLSSCTTEREYSVTHEQLVEAAILAIEEDSYMSKCEIKKTEKEEKGGKYTILETQYNTYSRLKAEIDSTGKHCNMPELQVKVTTDKILWTRHKDFEQRIHELVLLKLRSRKHGDESRPTALPPAEPKPKPALVPVPPPAPVPVPDKK